MSRSKRKAPKLIVEVRGGVVQAIYGDIAMDACIVDWDNIEAGDPGPADIVLMDGTSAWDFMKAAPLVTI